MEGARCTLLRNGPTRHCTPPVERDIEQLARCLVRMIMCALHHCVPQPFVLVPATKCPLYYTPVCSGNLSTACLTSLSQHNNSLPARHIFQVYACPTCVQAYACAHSGHVPTPKLWTYASESLSAVVTTIFTGRVVSNPFSSDSTSTPSPSTAICSKYKASTGAG